jgi:uncharacterized protein YqgC (DUF456 family)
MGLAALWFFGFYTHFQSVSIWGAVIFSVLTLLTILLDVFAPALGARGYKSSKWGGTGAIVGGLLGIFIMGPIGAIVGPFVGGFIGEYMHAANAHHALRVAWGSFVGMIIGSLFKLIVGISMFIYFVVVAIHYL